MSFTTQTFIRRAERDDLDTVVRWMECPDFQYFLYGDPARSPRQVREKIVAMLGRAVGHTMPGGIYLMIDSREYGPVGLLSLQNISWRNRSCSIDLYLGQAHLRNRMVSASAICLALEYCFCELNLHRVSAYIYSFNSASWRIFEKTGAKRELVLREHIVRDGQSHDLYGYGLLRPEYEAFRARYQRALEGYSLAAMIEGLADHAAEPSGVNLVFVLLLAVYVIHSLAMHRQEGPETAPQDTQIHRGMSAPLMPITLFLACQIFSTPFIMSLLHRPVVWVVFGALILFALFSQLKKNTAGGAGRLEAYYYISGGLLQTGLLGLGCYIGFVDGVLGRSLFDPEWVILGLVAGHIVFGISLIFSHRSLDTLGDIAAYALDPRPFGRFVGHSPHQVFACLDVSLIEELIYRVAAQGVLLAMTGSPWIAIGVTALLFSMVHRHFFYNHVVDSLEFLAFSLLLGVLYHVTGSFMLVVMIHMVRNIEIVYFDHATRPDTASGWRLTSEKAS